MKSSGLLAPIRRPGSHSACATRAESRKAESTWRFGELRQAVEGISGKVLADTLRDLERDGIVDRTAYDEMPPRVEYQLTALGQTLREPLTALGRGIH